MLKDNGKNKEELIKEISRLLKSKTGYTKYGLSLKKDELEEILLKLNNYNKKNPDNEEIIGNRPVRMVRPAESKTDYRKKMSNYIKENTGIYIPPYSTISSKFYDEVADFLGL